MRSDNEAFSQRHGVSRAITREDNRTRRRKRENDRLTCRYDMCPSKVRLLTFLECLLESPNPFVWIGSFVRQQNHHGTWWRFRERVLIDRSSLDPYYSLIQMKVMETLWLYPITFDDNSFHPAVCVQKDFCRFITQLLLGTRGQIHSSICSPLFRIKLL